MPALVILSGALMPDAVLNRLGGWITEEGAFVLRFWIVILGLAYVIAVVIARLWMFRNRRTDGDNQPLQWTGAAQGFPVISEPTDRGPGH